MADLQRSSAVERDIDQAITALKKGACLLKYGRRGKPKFCPFRLSSDESKLIWYYGKDEKQLELSHVSKIIPGQRTQIFQRYPRPEKEYQSFSLIHEDRSLDLICKDKDEAEVWFVGLKALIARGSNKKLRHETKREGTPSDSPRARRSNLSMSFDQVDTLRNESRWGKVFSDIVSFTAANKPPQLVESVACSSTPQPASTSQSSSTPQPASTSLPASTPLQSSVSLPASTSPPIVSIENSNTRTSGAETIRASLSSAVSSSSQGSCNDDFDTLGDVFIWGEGIGEGVMGGGLGEGYRSSNPGVDALLPKALESTVVLDVQNIACGQRHAVLVTKQGEIFSWGEEAGGRLGHGVETDVLQPKLIETLSGKSVQKLACGKYHTCAITRSGDLYTWGDGSLNGSLLGHGSEASHWIPKRVDRPIDGLQVSFVSCGPWHTAFLTSLGQLFTFGDGTFGALGHGDRTSAAFPREVEALKGLRTDSVSCGVWHTAAVVKITDESSDSEQSNGSLHGKLFTWGDGDKNRLGHGDNESRLVPECIASLIEVNFARVACGNNNTVALTTSGKVYTMGSTSHGQLGSPEADGKTPLCIGGYNGDGFVEDVACGAHHVVVLTTKGEVYTWGKGTNGQLGHGDNDDRSVPTIVGFLKDRQAKGIACGSNFTAVICLHKWICSADNSVCSGCRNPFTFRRKRHNCYNCGLVFCNACSSKKSLKASLAPNTSKPFRVCDDCFTKLQKAMEFSSVHRLPKVRTEGVLCKPNELTDKELSLHRLQGQVGRLSSADSFKSERSSIGNSKSELNDTRLFPLHNGDHQRPSTSSKSPTSPVVVPRSLLSFSVPNSRVTSRSPSPAPGKWNPLGSTTMSPPFLPFQTTEETTDDLKSKNDTLSQEVISLKAQVEELTSKSQLLEVELERKSKQLQEVSKQAADEAGKSKAAKEVIKSLTVQLKEMAAQVEPFAGSKLDTNDQTTNDTSHPSNGSSLTSSPASGGSCDNPTPPPVSNRTPPVSNGSPSISNGTNSQVQKSERTIQDEPGVYITVIALPSGVNELRRVRFSRKRFTEEQAEIWWNENGTRVCERHNIQTTE